MKRIATLLCIATLLAGCGERHEVTTPPPSISVTVAIGAQTAAVYAPLYAAVANGDFTKAGLSVTVAPSASDAAALAQVASGAAQLAVASEPQLLVARDSGAPLMAIGALVQTPLEALIAAKHAISSPSRLAGRTVALPDDPFHRAELDTALRAAGVAPTSVHRLSATNGVARMLLAGKADAGLGYFDDDAVLLALHNVPAQAFRIDTAGVPTYTQLAIVVSQASVRRDGPELRALLQALTRSAAAVRGNPGTAVDELVSARAKVSRRLTDAALRATLPVYLPTDTSKPFGYQDPRAWGTFGSWMLSKGLIGKPVDALNSVTDEFLPGQGE
jgi:ABC-type nitrate/sulfonate/bicarbonate transport system substrate-binding protein